MLGAAIEVEGGIIAQYVGDAVVAIFGALVPLPNHAAAAMRAALAAQNKLRAEMGKAGAFKIRIGLNTGSCESAMSARSSASTIPRSAIR
jgi:class 3 adenylate cyclase